MIDPPRKEQGSRRIAVFTGSRAEYGLQYPVLKAIAERECLDYVLIAGGGHFQDEFGATIGEIVADGFTSPYEAASPPDSDSIKSTPEVIARSISRVAEALDRTNPDIVLVYGDRSETFGAAIAASQSNRVLAHIEGGDYTEGGTLDDSVRHAITKLAHIHFPTNADAAERLLRMGEEPWRIFLVGLPSLDLIAAGEFASPEELETGLGLVLTRPVVLFCQHSVATESDQTVTQIRRSLKALRGIAARGYQIVATYPNNDPGARIIIEELECLRGEAGLRIVPHLGRHRFHGLLNLIGRVTGGTIAGNSSAGIKESPAFGAPAVNIGSRQAGRLRASNVIDVEYDSPAIEAAIVKASTDRDFQARCRDGNNPYWQGSAGRRVADVLASIRLDGRLLRKRMGWEFDRSDLKKEFA